MRMSPSQIALPRFPGADRIPPNTLKSPNRTRNGAFHRKRWRINPISAHGVGKGCQGSRQSTPPANARPEPESTGVQYILVAARSEAAGFERLIG
jgi:hypothetical protein